MVTNRDVNEFLGLPSDFDPDQSASEESSDSGSTIQWTKDQQGLLAWYDSIISNPGKQVMTVAGSAGTGKTFVTSEMIRRVKALHSSQSWYRVAVMAPTNKAVRILADKLTGFGFNLDYSIYNDDGKIDDPNRVYIGTIHKFLRAIPNSTDPEIDESELVFNLDGEVEERPINRMNVIFVDESSMVGRDFYELILASNNGIIVFIGDQFQLFPVDNTYEVSPVFKEVENKYCLNEVVRYDGMVLKVATQLREMMEDEMFARAYSFRNFDLEELTVVRNKNGYMGTDWYKLLLQYAKDQYDDGLHPDFVRALVYKRRTREVLNNQLRRDLFGAESIDKFIKGEWLFTHSQCSSYISMADRTKILRAQESNDPGYSELKDEMKENLIRLGNARDYQVVSCKTSTALLECPTEDLDHIWKVLIQEFTLVTLDSYLGQLDIAVMTEDQLKRFAANKQTIIKVCQGYRSEIITSYLKQMNYCFNVTESNVKWVAEYEKDLVYHNLGYGSYPSQVKVSSKIQPGYVLTVHQSQGSTIDHAFVMYNDYFTKHPEVDPFDAMSLLFRLTYTGLTRTAKSAKVFTKY